MTGADGFRMLHPTRVEFGASLTVGDLRQLAQRPELQTLQCSAAVPDPLWSLVDAEFFSVRPDVQLRVYGMDYGPCDLSFLRLLPRVRHFAADCLRHATGIEHLAALPKLESLSLGIFDLTDFAILEQMPTQLVALCLGPTRSKRPTLAPLRRFPGLRRLYLEGQSRDLAVLGESTGIEELTLRSISMLDLQFLAAMRRLASLEIKLGGLRSFAGLEGKASLRYLELWQVRGVRHVDFVGDLPGLQNLFLQSLPHVAAFPSLVEARSLRRIVVENLKGLRDLTTLQQAPALEEFALRDGRNQLPELLLPVLRNPGVRRVGVGFGKEGLDREFERLRQQHGKAEFVGGRAFDYR